MIRLSLRWRPRFRPRLPLADRRGTVAVITALCLPVCTGVMALGIDVSYWEVVRVQCQAIADAAAMGGAEHYAESGYSSLALTTAANIAELNGVTPGTRGGDGTTTLTDNSTSWTASFSFSSSAQTVTATISTSAPLWFGRLLTTATSQTIAATAVASMGKRTGGSSCVLGLNGSATGVTTYVDLSISGNTTISSTHCGVRSDGQLTVSGNATLSVPNVVASGGIGQSGNAQINCTGSSCQWGNAPQLTDPLASSYESQLSVPAGGSPQGSATTLNPGTYSSGLSFGSNNTYKLNAGVYYVNGSISVAGNSIISGAGVTLISTGGISMSGNSVLTLTAPSSGSTAGLLFGTTASSSITISGNSNANLNGAIYAPNASVKVSGNSTEFASQSTCVEIVAQTVSFSGNSDLDNSGCASLGAPTIYNLPSTVQLTQ